MTSKKALSERDICTKYILPALEKAGWNVQRQIREEVSFTDGNIEKELSLDEFPSPETLQQRYKKHKGIVTDEQESISQQDYFHDPTDKPPRYYQQIAINRTVDAIAQGKKRILFLADRNVLISQAMRNDFRHFKDKMTCIKHKKIDKSYEIYLALYQE